MELVTDSFQLVRVYQVNADGEQTIIGNWPYYHGKLRGAIESLPEGILDAINREGPISRSPVADAEGTRYFWKISSHSN